MDYSIAYDGGSLDATDDPPVFAAILQFWVSGHNIANPEYDKSFIEDPGVDGVLIKRGGYRSNRLMLNLVATGPDKSALCSYVRAQKIVQANQPLTVTIGDEEYLGCELEPNSVEDTPKPMLMMIDDALQLLYRVEYTFSYTSRQTAE